MKLNCKPGDMAIVVPPSTNAGAIVDVVGSPSAEHFTGLPSWHIKTAGGALVGRDRRDPNRRTHRLEGVMPDAWLRPVSGLPVDEETRDEVTT